MMELQKYAEEILNLYNFISEAIITDKNGVIEYYYNNRPDVNSLSENEVLGKSILEIYPSITRETSTIMQVISTGIPIIDDYSVKTNIKGEQVFSTNQIFPVKENGNTIGAVGVSRFIETSTTRRANIMLSPDMGSKVKEIYRLEDIITCADNMKAIKEKVSKIAQHDSTVLIYGETGTGKELIAESIHSEGRRKNEKFISQNCAAIPGTLLESILFGTVKGSFTGSEDRAGLFEIADKGTLFLDEINLMDISVQAKILKAIEEQKITRVGATEQKKIDVRIVAAINVDPRTCVADGTLRHDLYYRLKVVEIDLPPLRKRKGDVDLLSNYYINWYNNLTKKKIIDLSDSVKKFFNEYRWPGNIRELRNAIEGAFNYSYGQYILFDDLDWYEECKEDIIDPKEESNKWKDFNFDIGLKKSVRQYEKEIIENTIYKCKTLSEAAGRLGLSKQLLNKKIKDLEIKYK